MTDAVTADSALPLRPGRATAVAPANIAFIKYWGATDLARAVPVNPSISMTLSECVSRTTVEFDPAAAGDDEVWIGRAGETGDWRDPGASFSRRVRTHLAELRRRLGVEVGSGRFQVVTENSFPAAAGMASSASGFSALAVAVAAALGASPSSTELSALARCSGSGSAARSVMGGYVEWPAPGEADHDSSDPRAVQLFPADHWRLSDVIAVVETGPKEVSSLEGHTRAPSSPYFEHRLGELHRRLEAVRRGLVERDFQRLGQAVEEEAIDLHLIAMSSRPPVYYWVPATLAVLAAVRALRADGIAAWSTMDAGANVHVITTPEHETAVAEALAAVDGVHTVIRDRVGAGPTVEVEAAEVAG